MVGGCRYCCCCPCREFASDEASVVATVNRLLRGESSDAKGATTTTTLEDDKKKNGKNATRSGTTTASAIERLIEWLSDTSDDWGRAEGSKQNRKHQSSSSSPGKGDNNDDGCDINPNYNSPQKRKQVDAVAGSECSCCSVRGSSSFASGGGNSGPSCAQRRGKISLIVLNAIRDTCRPFLEDEGTSSSLSSFIFATENTTATTAAVVTAAVTPQKQPEAPTQPAQQSQQPSSYIEEFPSLAFSASAAANQQRHHCHHPAAGTPIQQIEPKNKPKRRIRPVTVSLPTSTSSSNRVAPLAPAASATGNLTSAPSCDEPMRLLAKKPPFPISSATASLSSSFAVTPQKTSGNAVIPSALNVNAAAFQARANSRTAGSRDFFAAELSSNMSQEQHQHQLPSLDETKEQVMVLPELTNLVDVYCTLIRSCLVPSTALELELLIYLLRLRPTNDQMKPRQADTSPTGDTASTFSAILCTPLRCHCFAVLAFSNISSAVLQMGEAFVKALLSWQPFRVHCLHLCMGLQEAIDEKEAAVQHGAVCVVPNRQTALLTLPFNHERDSRHNFKSREELQLYKNREAVRDAFLYQLRSFLNVRGKVVDVASADEAISRIKSSSRDVVNLILDTNLPWFTEFFCDILVQIGLVPLEETDADVLKIASNDQDKLQKLHRRFSAKASQQGSRSKSVRKHPVNSPRNDEMHSSDLPGTIVQQNFPGHQEFFFLFLTSADSYKLGNHLKVRLVACIKQRVTRLSIRDLEVQMMELCLFARFLGVLLFSPNWIYGAAFQSSVKMSTKATTSCGLKELDSLGICISELVKNAWKTKSLVSVVPWVVELLKLTIWDEATQGGKLYYRLLSLLRHIQLRTCAVQRDKDERMPYSRGSVLVSQYLESLFGDVVGIAAHSDFRIATPLLPDMRSSKGQEVKVLDDNIVYTLQLLFASNPHVEELHDLISRLTREDYVVSFQGPGASRRLRPSSIHLSPSVVDMSPSKAGWDTKGLSIFNESSSGTLDSVQSKLQDAFFHQHPSLKDACEFVGSSAIKVSIARLPSECIRPLLDDITFEETGSSKLNKVVFDRCQLSMRKMLEEIIRGAIRILSVPDYDEKVIDIAVSLSVTNSMRSSRGMLTSLVANELSTFRANPEAKDGKRLFENDCISNALGQDSASEKDLWLRILTKAIDDLRILLESTWNDADFPLVPDLLRAILLALDDPGVDSYRIPEEDRLRSFYQSVMLLDRHSKSLLDCVLSNSREDLRESTELMIYARWCIVSDLIRIAIRVKRLSHQGLRTLSWYISNGEMLRPIIELGLLAIKVAPTAEDEETYREKKIGLSNLATLLIETVEARVLKASLLEHALLSLSGNDDANILLARECVAVAGSQASRAIRFERLADMAECRLQTN